MQTVSRRTFVGASAVGLAGAALPILADPLKLPAGFQVYPVKDDLLKDFSGTLKKFADIGYRSVEMCSPPGYGWAPLTKMTASEMKQIIGAAGLRCCPGS